MSAPQIWIAISLTNLLNRQIVVLARCAASSYRMGPNHTLPVGDMRKRVTCRSVLGDRSRSLIASQDGSIDPIGNQTGAPASGE
jgi:hypothetical protein